MAFYDSRTWHFELTDPARNPLCVLGPTATRMKLERHFGIEREDDISLSLLDNGPIMSHPEKLVENGTARKMCKLLLH